jgi:hypothetical protein
MYAFIISSCTSKMMIDKKKEENAARQKEERKCGGLRSMQGRQVKDGEGCRETRDLCLLPPFFGSLFFCSFFFFFFGGGGTTLSAMQDMMAAGLSVRWEQGGSKGMVWEDGLGTNRHQAFRCPRLASVVGENIPKKSTSSFGTTSWHPPCQTQCMYREATLSRPSAIPTQRADGGERNFFLLTAQRAVIFFLFSFFFFLKKSKSREKRKNSYRSPYCRPHPAFPLTFFFECSDVIEKDKNPEKIFHHCMQF